MNNKRNIMITLIIIYFIITFGVNFYNKQQKYLILSNDYAFKVTNSSIKAVEEYPKFFKDYSINYYDQGRKNNGYIRLSNNKKIYYYNKKLNKLKLNPSIISTVNIDNIKVNYITDEIIDDKDISIINNYLDDNGFDSDDELLFIKKVKVEINKDKSSKEYLYIVSNHYTEDELISSRINEANDDSFELAFIHSEKSDYTLFERKGKESNYFSNLTNIFDYNNDNINEISFMNYSITDHEHNCAEIYYLSNNEFVGEENCKYILEVK